MAKRKYPNGYFMCDRTPTTIPDLSIYEQMVMFYFESIKNYKDMYPSYRAISHWCRMSERQAQYTIESLINKGHISVKYRQGKTNTYKLPSETHAHHASLPTHTMRDTHAHHACLPTHTMRPIINSIINIKEEAGGGTTPPSIDDNAPAYIRDLWNKYCIPDNNSTG